MESFLLALAVAVSLGWWLPQLVRVLRAGSTGVSSTTWAVGTANLLLWAWWAYTAGQEVVAAAELVQAIGSAFVLARVGFDRRTVLAAGTVAGVVLLCSPFPALAAVAAVASAAAVRLPQVFALLRTAGAHAVSTSTWVISAVGNVCWAAWAVAAGEMTMLVGASLSVSLSLTVAYLASRRTLRELESEEVSLAGGLLSATAAV